MPSDEPALPAEPTASPAASRPAPVLKFPRRERIDRPRDQRPTAVPPETSELLIFLQPDADPREFARDYGLVLKDTLRSVATAHIFAAASPAAAKAVGDRAPSDPRVAAAVLNERTRHVAATRPYPFDGRDGAGGKAFQVVPPPAERGSNRRSSPEGSG
jgi:hypothetical protein